MVLDGNKAKRLSSVNHTTKTIHHHQPPFILLTNKESKGIKISCVKFLYSM